jgi:hypothetical protein
MGNKGLKDGIYWCKSVGDTIDGPIDVSMGSHFNEITPALRRMAPRTAMSSATTGIRT